MPSKTDALFSVNGLVAVITGGGSGELFFVDFEEHFTKALECRYWTGDGKIPCRERSVQSLHRWTS